MRCVNIYVMTFTDLHDYQDSSDQDDDVNMAVLQVDQWVDMM